MQLTRQMDVRMEAVEASASRYGPLPHATLAYSNAYYISTPLSH